MERDTRSARKPACATKHVSLLCAAHLGLGLRGSLRCGLRCSLKLSQVVCGSFRLTPCLMQLPRVLGHLRSQPRLQLCSATASTEPQHRLITIAMATWRAGSICWLCTPKRMRVCALRARWLCAQAYQRVRPPQARAKQRTFAHISSTSSSWCCHASRSCAAASCWATRLWEAPLVKALTVLDLISVVTAGGATSRYVTDVQFG